MVKHFETEMKTAMFISETNAEEELKLFDGEYLRLR